MMEYLNILLDNYNLPIISAFLLGILASLSPCTLATNITAVAYISRDIKTPRFTILSAFFYTLGRGISYTILATLIYLGISSFQISRLFQGWGDKILGPVLIIIGLVMFGVIKLNLKSNNEKIEKIKIWLADKGYLGSLALGILFAFAFCPYSGVIFFGMLMPLVVNSVWGLFLPPLFALGTGLAVIFFAVLIAFSMQAVGKAFHLVQKTEKWLRYGVAGVFVLTGIYYLQFLFKFLINLF
ncbi:MAG TPA: aromatic aminobenezylarsenical efflux permease ArsG family transporter [Candidatus Magasanikbacteria bacterium]|nr:aromatic aminobenezylarsenical efflux permease ArsG family transporter [Candidatus Magasanikbacteria bacterium]